MNRVIYTAVTNGFDKVLEPRVKTPGWDYVCFTDNVDMPAPGWEKIPILPGDTSPRRVARRYKLLPHVYLKGYDVSIWMDGCYKIRHEISSLAEIWLREHDFALRKHPWRDPECVYAEVRACIRKLKGDPYEVIQQGARYRMEKYPENNGIYATGIVVRRHCKEVEAFCEKWWDDLCIGSDRDQLSFPVVAWREKFKFNAVDAPNRTNDHKPFFVWSEHRK